MKEYNINVHGYIKIKAKSKEDLIKKYWLLNNKRKKIEIIIECDTDDENAILRNFES